MRLTLTRLLMMALVTTGGAGAAAYYSGAIDLPTYGIEDIGDWGAVTDDEVDIHTTLWLHNPNQFDFNLSGVRATYRIQMNDVPLARGEQENLSITEGNNTVELTTSLRYNNIPEWWARHLRRGESSALKASAQIYLGFLPTTFSIDGITYTDTINTDLIGMMNDALSQMEGEYVGPGTTVAGIDTRPRVEIHGGSAEWGSITRDTTWLHVTLNMHNPNPYPIPLPGLDGDLVMNDITVGEWSGNTQLLDAPADSLIPAGATREATYRIVISNDKIDDWFISHVKNTEHTDASTTFRLRFDIGDITLYVPQTGGVTCTFRLTTAILEDDNTEESTFGDCSSGTLTLNSDSTDSSGSDQQDDPQDDSTDESDDGELLDGLTGNMIR